MTVGVYCATREKPLEFMTVFGTGDVFEQTQLISVFLSLLVLITVVKMRIDRVTYTEQLQRVESVLLVVGIGVHRSPPDAASREDIPS